MDESARFILMSCVACMTSGESEQLPEAVTRTSAAATCTHSIHGMQVFDMLVCSAKLRTPCLTFVKF